MADEKTALRREIRRRVSQLDSAQEQAGNRLLLSQVQSLPEISSSASFFLFRGVGHEPDTLPLISGLLKRGKKVFLPRTLGNGIMECRRVMSPGDLVPGAFGIPEPTEDCPAGQPEDIDFCLVPAVCYDIRGFRLGHGGGYYDRWLSGFSGIRVGICRDCLLQDHVPTQIHDEKVHILVTETRILRFDP